MNLKLYTFLFLFLTLSVFAKSQSLTFNYNGSDVSGSEITVSGSASDEEIKVIIYITNTTENDLSVKVKKRILVDLEGSENTFCLLNCFAPNVTESPDPINIEAGTTTGPDDFYVQFYPNGNSGEAQISYEAFLADNPDDKVTVTVIFNIVPTGIGLNRHFAKLNAYPNPVVGSKLNISYSIPGSFVNSKIALYNILGVKVAELPVYEPSSTIDFNVSSLPKGVYFYSLEVDGRNAITKRVVIR